MEVEKTYSSKHKICAIRNEMQQKKMNVKREKCVPPQKRGGRVKRSQPKKKWNEELNFVRRSSSNTSGSCIIVLRQYHSTIPSSSISGCTGWVCYPYIILESAKKSTETVS
jgi:hypothetical protein